MYLVVVDALQLHQLDRWVFADLCVSLVDDLGVAEGYKLVVAAVRQHYVALDVLHDLQQVELVVLEEGKRRQLFLEDGDERGHRRQQDDSLDFMLGCSLGSRIAAQTKTDEHYLL